jgi:hypothetical protein
VAVRIDHPRRRCAAPAGCRRPSPSVCRSPGWRRSRSPPSAVV